MTEAGAGIFASAFYIQLFLRENVGLAFPEASNSAMRDLGEASDLTYFSAILYRDAVSKHCQGLAVVA